jgi:hypothetical protein
MTDTDDESGGVWAGVSTIVVAVLAISVFVFTTEPVNAGGVVAGLALALMGLGQVLAPRVSPWFERLGHRWVGLCWILVGGTIAALGLVASSTIGGRWWACARDAIHTLWELRCARSIDSDSLFTSIGDRCSVTFCRLLGAFGGSRFRVVAHIVTALATGPIRTRANHWGL